MGAVPSIYAQGCNVDYVMGPPLVPFSANNYQAPATGARTVLADVPANGSALYIRQIHCSYSAAPTAGLISIKDGSTTVWSMQILTGGEHTFDFPMPKANTPGNTMSVVLSDGGVTGSLYADIYSHV